MPEPKPIYRRGRDDWPHREPLTLAQRWVVPLESAKLRIQAPE